MFVTTSMGLSFIETGETISNGHRMHTRPAERARAGPSVVSMQGCRTGEVASVRLDTPGLATDLNLPQLWTTPLSAASTHWKQRHCVCGAASARAHRQNAQQSAAEEGAT